MQGADPATDKEGVGEEDHEDDVELVARNVGSDENHELCLHQGAGEGVAQVPQTIDIANVQPTEHGEESCGCLRNAHGNVEVPTVGDSIRTLLLGHIRPGLHQSPPLVHGWRDVVPKHAPRSVDWLLDICPHHDAEGEVGEEEAENDARKALDRERRVEWAACTKELEVVELFQDHGWMSAAIGLRSCWTQAGLS